MGVGEGGGESQKKKRKKGKISFCIRNGQKNNVPSASFLCGGTFCKGLWTGRVHYILRLGIGFSFLNFPKGTNKEKKIPPVTIPELSFIKPQTEHKKLWQMAEYLLAWNLTNQRAVQVWTSLVLMGIFVPRIDYGPDSVLQVRSQQTAMSRQLFVKTSVKGKGTSTSGQSKQMSGSQVLGGKILINTF